MIDDTFHLPARSGPPPRTSGPAPHQQVTQNAPRELQAELFARVLSLPGVQDDASRLSVEGARAFTLERKMTHGPADAFMVGNEFAHLHPQYDGSLHLRLEPAVAREVVAQGWGEPHPIARTWPGPPVLMIFGPRDTAELDVITRIVTLSYELARGPL